MTGVLIRTTLFRATDHNLNLVTARFTQINEFRSAGQYEMTFDASHLASGTYIYRVEAGNRVRIKTMMLIK